TRYHGDAERSALEAFGKDRVGRLTPRNDVVVDGGRHALWCDVALLADTTQFQYVPRYGDAGDGKRILREDEHRIGSLVGNEIRLHKGICTAVRRGVGVEGTGTCALTLCA